MKKELHITGRILSPLQEGTRAIIQHGGDTIFTSPVVEIKEFSDDYAHFETMNSVYRVSLIALPIKSAMPKPLAMCA